MVTLFPQHFFCHDISLSLFHDGRHGHHDHYDHDGRHGHHDHYDHDGRHDHDSRNGHHGCHGRHSGHSHTFSVMLCVSLFLSFSLSLFLSISQIYGRFCPLTFKKCVHMRPNSSMSHFSGFYS